MSEGRETPRQNLTEAQRSLRARTWDFFIRHRFTIPITLGQTITTNIYLFHPNIESVIYNTLIGAAGGLVVGSLINRYETRSDWRR